MPEVCKQLGVSPHTYYRWRKKYGGIASVTSDQGQGLTNVGQMVISIIRERQAFLQEQVAWREKVAALITQLRDSAKKQSPDDVISQCQVLVHKIPEIRDTLLPLMTRLEELSKTQSDVFRQLQDQQTTVDKAAHALNLSLGLPDKRKASKSIDDRREQTAFQMTLVEKRNERWTRLCAFLPGFLVKWFFRGFFARMQDEIDAHKDTLQQLSFLGQSLVDWTTKHQECEALLAEVRQASAEIAKCSKILKRRAASLLGQRMRANTQALQNRLCQLPPYLDAKWSGERCDGSSHNDPKPPSHVVVGSLVERPLDTHDSHMHFPLLLPFIGHGHSLLLESGKSNESATRELFLSLMLRVMMMLPHHSHILLLDPKGQGRACPFANLFASIECQTVRMHDALDERVAEISRIIHDYIDDRMNSFEKLPFSARMNEKFEFIFAANFPEDYDRRSIELLQRISKNGPVAGKYLIIEHEPSAPMPHGVSIEMFSNLLSLNTLELPLPKVDISQLDLEVAKLPSGDLVRRLADSMASNSPPEMTVEWHDVINADQEQWWTQDAADRIESSIGIAGRATELSIWFGASQNNRPCAHGMLGAMTGSGKSNLYHMLICGLATRYSPDQLRLYLIDGKDGVEFQPYKQLPHSAAVSLNTAPELARSILEELLAEKERRNALFAEMGVPDLQSFRRKCPNGPIMPRILLLVDEYQELLEDDHEGAASAQLLQIAQQGRSVGIHMLLGSQRFGVTGLLHQTAIFGNIHLRIAMKMAAADISALTEFGPAGKRLIRNCDLPGKIVVNDDSGSDQANLFGKVALIPRENVDALIQGLIEKGHGLDAESCPLPSVFDGKSQPLLMDNPQFIQVISAAHRLSMQEWEHHARQPLHRNGLENENWYAGDSPFVMWIGQELNMYGQAHVILRRQPMENVILVGGNHAPRYGMLACMLASLSCVAGESHPPSIRVVDSSSQGTPWEGLLESAIDTLFVPIGCDAKCFGNNFEISTVLDELTEELRKRLELNDSDRHALSPMCVFIGDASKYHSIRKIPGRIGGIMEASDKGKLLHRICAEGPSVGIHCILAFSTFASAMQVMDRQHIESFRHRIALQMSEEDAFTFMRSRTASRLQAKGATPVLALYGDIVGGQEVRFKPYAMRDKVAAEEMFKGVFTSIDGWENVK